MILPAGVEDERLPLHFRRRAGGYRCSARGTCCHGASASGRPPKGTCPQRRAVAMAGVERVVVGASGSPGSLAALRYAECLARAHDAILMPVLAWEPPGGDRAAQVQPTAGLIQEWRQLACQRLGVALAAVWGEPLRDPMVRPRVERGPVGWVLVNVADQRADVLVVGAGRRGVLRRAALCRVSRYCAARARCPVILVPRPDLAAEIGRARLAWRLWHRTLTPAQVLADQRRSADR